MIRSPGEAAAAAPPADAGEQSSIAQALLITPGAASADPEANKCAGCANAVGDDDKALCCELCSTWWHIKCGKVGKTFYDHVVNNSKEKARTPGSGQFRWYCSDCYASMPSHTSIGEIVTNAQSTLLERLQALESRTPVAPLHNIDELLAAKFAEATAPLLARIAVLEATNEQAINVRIDEATVALKARISLLEESLTKTFTTTPSPDDIQNLATAAAAESATPILARIALIEDKITTPSPDDIQNLATAAAAESATPILARIALIEDKITAPITTHNNCQAALQVSIDDATSEVDRRLQASIADATNKVDRRLLALEEQSVTVDPTNITDALSAAKDAIKNEAISISKEAITSDIKANPQTWANIAALHTDAAPKQPSKPGVITVPPILRSQLTQVIDDQAEADKRRNNLLAFNLPESPTVEDRAQVQEIFDICEVPLKDEDIVKVERRGKKPSTAKEPARPLLIQFSGPEKKKRLLTNLQKYRDFQLNERPKGDDGTKPDQVPMVRIDHDMTVAQREHKKILLAQAHEESKQGPHRFVVRGPPWALKKVAIPRTAAAPPNPAAPQTLPPAKPAAPKVVPPTKPAAPKVGLKPMTAPRWFTHPNPSEPAAVKPASPTGGASAW